MKKLLCMVLIFAFLCPAFAIHAEESSISVVLNGDKLKFDVPPMLINDRTMVPLRAIFEALGAKVNYEDATRLITATRADTTVSLTVDSNIMYVNDATVTLDVPATVINDRTLVPVRAVSEAFSCNVGWDGASNTVLIVGKSDINTQSNLKITGTSIGSVKAKLHANTRRTFEEKVFPALLFGNQNTFRKMLTDTREEALKVIDEQIWLLSMDDAIASHLLATDSNFKNLNNDDAITQIDAKADEYALWPHQNYNIDLFKLNVNDICLVVNLSTFEKTHHVSATDLQHISPFLAVVYETDSGKLHYFRCLSENLVERGSNGNEKTISGFCSTKIDFLNGLTQYFADKNLAITAEETSAFPSDPHTAFTADGSSGGPILLFRPNEAIENVTFYSVTSAETAYDTKKPLCFFDAISPDIPFAANIVFQGDLHTYGISFTDSKGSKRFFVLETSFEDGSMHMKEIFGF